MFRKFRMIIITILTKIRHRNSIKINGFSDFSASTQITVHSGGHMMLGSRIKTGKDVELAAVKGGVLKVGNNVGFNSRCVITAQDNITIGDNCLFGPGVLVFDHDHRFDSSGIKLTEYEKSSIVIENNCWIASNVIILKGTYIGEGSVIGAGIVLKGNIPAHSIVTSKSDISVHSIKNISIGDQL